ncbi:hypothetical protein HAX54_009173, partial [Datura stramonium]|nr:hypothetical protein [Datura stramonium]
MKISDWWSYSTYSASNLQLAESLDDSGGSSSWRSYLENQAILLLYPKNPKIRPESGNGETGYNLIYSAINMSSARLDNTTRHQSYVTMYKRDYYRIFCTKSQNESFCDLWGGPRVV